MRHRLWELEELRVLVAIYFNSEFAIGDDARNEARAIADAFGRSPASIDRQWRNIRAVIDADDRQNVGQSLKKAIQDYWADPESSRAIAMSICTRKGWKLDQLITGESGSRTPLVRDGSVDLLLADKLRDFSDRIDFKFFKTGSQGFFRQGKVTMPDGRKFQCQVSAILIGSKNDPMAQIRTERQTLSFEMQKVLSNVRPKIFRSGRSGFYANGKVAVGEERFQVAIQAVEIGSQV